MIAKRSAALAVAVVLVFAGALSLLSGISTVEIRATDPTPAVSLETPVEEFECFKTGGTSNFAAWPAETKERPWSFGPPSTASVLSLPTTFAPITAQPNPKQTADELVVRLCGNTRGSPWVDINPDDALYRSLMSAMDKSDPNATLEPSAWKQGVEYLVNHGLQFGEAHIEFIEHDEGYSLYMEPRNSGVRVGASAIPKTSGWYYIIPVVLEDGSKHTLRLRLDCGFQPKFERAVDLPPSLQHLV